MNVKKLNSILLAGILCLSPFGIQASTTYATSEDGSKSYTSIDDAWDAAQDGTRIVMQEDWNLSSRLVLDSNKFALIEMNGHKISRNLTSAKTNGEVIKLCSNSTLNLTGENAPNTTFHFNGYVDGVSTNCTTRSGGLITGGYSTNGAGAIHMKSGSHLNMHYVSISGNKSNRSLGSDGHGGAIYMDGKYDGLTMWRSEITFNAAQRDGGGVYINNSNSVIEMIESDIVNNTAGASLTGLDSDAACGGGIAVMDNDVQIRILSNSKVDDNYAHGYGGGIYSNGKNTRVDLNDSSISYNRSDNNGGGIYFNYSYFELTSQNQSGLISYNEAQSSDSGGGLYAARCYFSSNQGKIDGITFEGNYATSGGGINIHQENVTVSNCTFTKNKAGCGGAINVQNDNFVLQDSTVQNNTTSNDYTGAIHVDGYNDITLQGIITITNNPNEYTGTDSDLCLSTIGVPKSYILSAPDASSKIGLYIDEARTLAKNQTSDATNIYYVNNPDKYTISYDDSSKEIVSNETTGGGGASMDWGESEQSEETQDTQTTNSQEETQIFTVTMNMVNEAGTWQNTQKMTVNTNTPFELQAPTVEDKQFVEFKDLPDSLTVENDLVKADSISEDIELTLVYSDEESESLETGSIFGDGNTIGVAIIIVAAVILGTFIFMKKKKSS